MMHIQLDKVGVSFDEKIILSDVNVEIAEGEFVSLVGESGVGKTTLLRLLYFDLMPTKGIVRVGLYSSESIRRKEIPQLRKMIGIAFQDFKLLHDRSVYDNVAFVMEVTNKKEEVIKERVEEVLTEVGLKDKMHKMPHVLSGGEQQRAMLARALANHPEILLADEPTGNLDLQTGLGILEVLKAINKKDTTVIMVSHNPEIVKQTGGRVLNLKGGKIQES